MSEHNPSPSLTPGTPKKTSWYQNRRLLLASAGAASLLVIFTLGAMVGKSSDKEHAAFSALSKRVSVLESQNDQEALSSLSAALKTLHQSQENTDRQIAALQTAMKGKASGESQAHLQEALSVLETFVKRDGKRLNAVDIQMKDMAERLLKSVPAPQPEKKPVPEKETTTAKKPTPAKRPVKSHSVRIARRAPFVLTGVEKRGTESWAAIAPKGYTSLSQVSLIGVGETLAGWTLVSASGDRATFRVHGRLTALNVVR